MLGEVRDASTGEPIAGADVRVQGLPLRTVTNDAGRFVLTAVPPGEQVLRIEMLGYRATELEGVLVRAGQPVEVQVRLSPVPIDVEGLVVEAERVRLVEPEVTATHEIVVGRELRELPVDAVEEAIELAPGVSDGHFRGGRVGQETYVVDGLALKNQLEGSTQGAALELSPTSLEEVEVVTGGFDAEHGSALSGVVALVTRRGDPERWNGRLGVRTDEWAPDALHYGFTGVSASAGGPLPLLPAGSAVFMDVLAQSMGDADPRARGLTCVRPEDGDPELADRIRSLRSAAPSLYCPYEEAALPQQAGDKLIGFGRVDVPIGSGFTLTGSGLYNRLQQELYTPELKYADEYRLGQRSRGGMLQLALDWAGHAEGRARHLTARAAVMRLDRHLGVIDPAWRADHASIGGFSLGGFEFLGEDFVRSDVNAQLRSGRSVPGYVQPGGSVGSPFGPAAEGLFVTKGGSGIANWSRSEFIAGELVGEVLDAEGSVLRAGTSGRFYRVQTYERVRAWEPGAVLNYARFFPATLAAFGEYRMIVADRFQVQFGLRGEMFRSGIALGTDPDDYLSPVADTDWKLSLMPRIGFAGIIPGTEDRGSFRLSYSRVAQPPDFRYFLDTTIGDSLRTDVRRQGNPNLGYEEGRSYELGGSYLLTPAIGVSVTAFRKDLLKLVSGSIQFADTEAGQFTTGDRGRVDGVEVSTRARWSFVSARLAYSLQKAEGVGTTIFGDSVISGDRTETFPLPFDRRHAVDLALFLGSAAGAAESPWAATLTATAHSGYPLERVASDSVGDGKPRYLPWTAVLDLRASRELGSPPGCDRCSWRVTVDGRNLLGRENVIAWRRDNASVAPTVAELDAVTAAGVFGGPIPRESARYSASIDLDADGLITEPEYRTARFAAALDRSDPSLFYGEAREVRLGVEVSF